MEKNYANLEKESIKNRRDVFLSFIDSVAVKGVIIFFLLFFIVCVLKAQTRGEADGKIVPVSDVEISMVNTDTMQSNYDYYSDNNETTPANLCKCGNEETAGNLNNKLAAADKLVNSYFLGIRDADEFYGSEKTENTLIVASTLIGTPVVGLINASVCAAVPPSKNTFLVPESKLYKDNAYMSGYQSEASCIKKHNTWAAYIMASVAWLCIAIFVVH